nr:proteasome inhibitor PI31 subunit [Arenicola marina]
MTQTVVEEFLNVGGHTTSVLKCGDILSQNVLVLIIPGNPGLSGYYTEFMQRLYDNSGQSKTPVWCVAHAGHGLLPESAGKSDPEENYCSLQGQVRHKLRFVADHIPRDTRLILIGHSIGCYMILHMLKKLDTSRVLKGLLLFPTIERLALSESGRRVTPVLKRLYWAAHFPLYPVYYLFPGFVKDWIVRWYFKGRGVHHSAIEATKRLGDPWTVRRVVSMANEEMQRVVDPDCDVIAANLNRLMFYYGSRDHWCPVQYYEDMKARFPDGDIMLCQQGIEHAFVLGSSKLMADIIWDWLHRKVGKALNAGL